MPTLTLEQERELFRRWRSDQDAQALTALLQSVRPYALFLARRLRPNRAAWDDAVAEAMAGALEAAWRFDPERGVRFVSYACPWMRAGMLGVARAVTAGAAEEPLERGGAEFLASTDAQADQVVGTTQASQLARYLASTLEPRLRTIVERRFLSDDPVTLADVARDLGLSRERARQLERDAVDKLRRRAHNERLTRTDLLAA